MSNIEFQYLIYYLSFFFFLVLGYCFRCVAFILSITINCFQKTQKQKQKSYAWFAKNEKKNAWKRKWVEKLKENKNRAKPRIYYFYFQLQTNFIYFKSSI